MQGRELPTMPKRLSRQEALFWRRRGAWGQRRAVGLVSALALLATTSFARAAMSYMVIPTQFEMHGRPGSTPKGAFEVRNTNQKEPLTIKFFSTELGQSADGGLVILENEEQKQKVKRPAADWVKITPEQITIAPGDKAIVNFQVTIPGHARGFYPIGLICEPNPPKPTPTPGGQRMSMGVTVIVRMVLRVHLFVMGATGRQTFQIASAEIARQAVSKEPNAPQRSFVKVKVANAGEMLGEVSVQATVYRLEGEQKRRIWSGTSETKEIFPDNTLTFSLDTGRIFAGGQYLVRAEAMSGGRRVATGENTMSLEGPPPTAAGMEEVACKLEPALLALEGQPGRESTGFVSFANTDESPLQVQVEIKPPAHLEALPPELQEARRSGALWLQALPAQFVIGPRQTRKVQLRCRIPPKAQGSYYGRLCVTATRLGKEVSALQEALVQIKTPTQEPLKIATGMLRLSEAEGGKYGVAAMLYNASPFHLMPKGSYRLLAEDGSVVRKGDLQAAQAVLLPECRTDLLGELDLKELAAGKYVLQASLVPLENASATELRAELDLQKGADGKLQLEVRPLSQPPAAEPAAEAEKEERPGGQPAPEAPPAGAPAAEKQPAGAPAGGD